MKYALLTQDQALAYLTAFENDIKSWRDSIYSIVDPLSSFTGNIKDALGVFKVAKHLKLPNIGMVKHIKNELKGNGER
ncbi:MULTISPECIES: hypothetical protein [Photorhabdus]|uniref:Uncharacterized protein n=1 Tax=Photorhabdus asymbiotica subsp. asymbiotica (strain ATCC 43949 / 3105-77) TaxID=553480 RepID=C7BJK6_PHOAA|nr:hypothetical protein [Photorhabdus asymbiotica]CAQ85531.1 Hypothetical protein PAU_03443 [Photorhabdus asymbiotica]